MSTTVKIILGLAIGILVLCLALAVIGFTLFSWGERVVGQSYQTETSNAVKVAESIADYDLPAGFGGAYAVHAAGYSLVGYTGEDEHSHIFLVQLPPDVHVNLPEIERQLRQAAPEADRQSQNLQVVSQEPATICGQDSTLVTSEGVNHDGQPYRQVMGMFQGREGQAAVLVSGLTATWDQTAVDEFIASIH